MVLSLERKTYQKGLVALFYERVRKFLYLMALFVAETVMALVFFIVGVVLGLMKSV